MVFLAGSERLGLKPSEESENFKHLLGRAPESFEEMKGHSAILDTKGFEADIDSYIDSLEYQEDFGENIVPYYRGFRTQVGQKNVNFSRMFQLFRGHSNSDRAQPQKRGVLTREVVQNIPSLIGVGSSGFLTEFSTGNRGSSTYRLRILQPPSPRSAVVRRVGSGIVMSVEQLSSKLQQLNRKGAKVSIVLS